MPCTPSGVGSVMAHCGFFHFSTWAPCQDDGQDPAPGHRVDLPASLANAAEEAECDLGPPASNAVAGVAFLILLWIIEKMGDRRTFAIGTN
jgi:hypothetical protein